MSNDPGKPDFSNVQGTASTAPAPKPDFSNVVGTASSVSAATASTAAAAAPVTYTVVAGDSLSKIAKHFYGDANQWQRIFHANGDKIKNPDVIHPGQVLTIPAAPAAAPATAASTTPSSANKA